MRRAAIIVASTLATAMAAHATERAILTPSTILNCPDAVRPSVEKATTRTLENHLRERGYAVEKLHPVVDSSVNLTELLSKTQADLAVSVRFEGAHRNQIQNDWSVVVRTLHRGEEVHTAEDRCADCFIGKEAQARMIAALDRALAASQPSVAVSAPQAAATTASESQPPSSTSTGAVAEPRSATPPPSTVGPPTPRTEPPPAPPVATIATTPQTTARRELSHGTRVALQAVGIGLVAFGVGGIAWGAIEAQHNGDQETRNG